MLEFVCEALWRTHGGEKDFLVTLRFFGVDSFGVLVNGQSMNSLELLPEYLEILPRITQAAYASDNQFFFQFDSGNQLSVHYSHIEVLINTFAYSDDFQ